MNELPLKPNTKNTTPKANGTKPTRVRTNIVILAFLSIVIAYMDRAKRVLAAGVAWWSIFTAVTPFANGLNSLWIVRALMGFGDERKVSHEN